MKGTLLLGQDKRHETRDKGESNMRKLTSGAAQPIMT